MYNATRGDHISWQLTANLLHQANQYTLMTGEEVQWNPLKCIRPVIDDSNLGRFLLKQDAYIECMKVKTFSLYNHFKGMICMAPTCRAI